MRAKVNEQRQWDRLMAMASIGAIAGDGVNRACLTELDRQARRLLIGWAKDIGASVSVDAAANLWLRYDGRDPRAAPVLTGSHMDTQPNGGRFDGIYGVIAGLEAIAAMHDAGVIARRPVEVVAWTNEEGGRYAPGCMGSMAWSGFRKIDEFAEVVDPDGVRFADALATHLTAVSSCANTSPGTNVPHATSSCRAVKDISPSVSGGIISFDVMSPLPLDREWPIREHNHSNAIIIRNDDFREARHHVRIDTKPIETAGPYPTQPARVNRHQHIQVLVFTELPGNEPTRPSRGFPIDARQRIPLHVTPKLMQLRTRPDHTARPPTTPARAACSTAWLRSSTVLPRSMFTRRAI